MINEAGTSLGPIVASRNMTLQATGTAGTVTGYISLDGETWTAINTYSFTGETETFDILVNTPGTLVKLETTGTFTAAMLLKED